jgi:hypothetical protein
VSMKYHMQLDIKGCLLHWGPRSHGGITDDNGQQLGNAETKALLLDELAKGHRYLSFGGCPDFDPVKGCTGHPIEGHGVSAVSEAKP